MAMIKCPECQKDISSAAKKCPTCGVVLEKPKKKSYFGIILAGILVLIVLGAISGNTDSTSSAASPATAQPDYIVSPQQIVAEYDANEIAADNKYKRKTVRITARIEDIGKDLMDSPFITFSDGQQFSMRGVQCYFKKSEAAKLGALAKGQQVTIQGKVKGLMMNVLIEDSIFID